MITSKDFLLSDTMVYASGASNRHAETKRYPSPKSWDESDIKLEKEETKVSIPTPEASR